jgi:Tol biopolymer transport system component
MADVRRNVRGEPQRNLESCSAPEERIGIALVDVASGTHTRLTTPPSGWRDINPVFSPDGREIAFRRVDGSWMGEVFVVRRDGGLARQITTRMAAWFGLAWTADSDEILFGSGRKTGIMRLWRVHARGTGSEPNVIGDAGEGFEPTLSRAGDRLAYSRYQSGGGLLRLSLTTPRGKPERLITSLGEIKLPHYSPDGRTLAFMDQTQIWLVDHAAPSNRIQLTALDAEVGAPRWSPDGRRIAFDARIDDADVYVIDADGSHLKRITTGPSEDTLPSWSGDGKWIYFSSNRTGTPQLNRVSVEGGAPVPMTTDGGLGGVESPDRSFLYYTREPIGTGLWRMSLSSGAHERIIDDEDLGSWTVSSNGIYYVHTARPEKERQEIRLMSLPQRRITAIHTLEGSLEAGLTVSPDRQWIAWPEHDYRSCSIMVGDNFR